MPTQRDAPACLCVVREQGQHFEEKWGGERGFVDMDVRL